MALKKTGTPKAPHSDSRMSSVSSFWLLVRRLLFRSRNEEIQAMALTKSYSLHCTISHEEQEEEEQEEQEEEEQGLHYCDDHLVEPLPDHLLPGFTSCQEHELLEEGKFPRRFLLDWEAGERKEEEQETDDCSAAPDSCLTLELSPGDCPHCPQQEQE